MVESYIANDYRSWRFDLDRFDPQKIVGTDAQALFTRFQYVLSVVFEAELHVSTAQGMESLTAFVREMPDRFEHEKLSLVMKRLGLDTVSKHVKTIR